MFINNELKRKQLEALLNTARSGVMVTRRKLGKILSLNEIKTIEDQYEFECHVFDYNSSLREYLAEYDELLIEGDKLYRANSRGKGGDYQFVTFYERALEVLREAKGLNPEIEQVLVVPSELIYGASYGSALVPENMPRYIYSRCKIMEGIKKKKPSFSSVAIDYIERYLEEG